MPCYSKRVSFSSIRETEETQKNKKQKEKPKAEYTERQKKKKQKNQLVNHIYIALWGPLTPAAEELPCPRRPSTGGGGAAGGELCKP